MFPAEIGCTRHVKRYLVEEETLAAEFVLLMSFLFRNIVCAWNYVYVTGDCSIKMYCNSFRYAWLFPQIYTNWKLRHAISDCLIKMFVHASLSKTHFPMFLFKEVGWQAREFVEISSHVCEISCCDQWLIILAKTICWRIATRKTCAFQKNDHDRQSSSEYACHSNSEKDESNFSNLIQCLNYNRYWISTWNMICVASCSVHQNICAHHMIKHEWLIYICVWLMIVIDW